MEIVKVNLDTMIQKKKLKKKKRKTIFYGTKTKYKIEDDSLYIFNLVTKKWDASKIVGINTKNLKLNSEKISF